MSGYFGALIRSSGIAIGVGAGPARVSSPFELDLEQGIHEPVQTTQPQAVTAASRNAPAADTRIETRPAAARQTDEPARRAISSAQPVPVSTFASPRESVDVPRHASADAVAPENGDGAAPIRSTLVAGTMIQAALQWVGSGNEAQPWAGTRLPAPESTVPSSGRAQAASSHATPVSDGVEVHLAEQSPLRPRGSPSTLARDAMDESPSPAARARPIQSERAERAVPRDRAEAIEVSIGAIHVRVDAPAPYTVAVPAAGAVASPPERPAPAAQSSRLARRALRRI